MGKVFLDKIPATEHIESVVSKTDDFANGQFLSLGLLDEDGESRLASAAKDEASAEVFLADAPIDYGETEFDIATWKLKAGKVGRAYHLQKGDYISVTPDLVAGTPAVGDHLTIGANGLGFAKVSADTDKGIARIVGQENHGFDGTVFVITIL